MSFQKEHELHYYMRDFVAYTAGMALYEVFLESVELVKGDVFSAQRPESCCNAVKRFGRFFDFAVEIVATLLNSFFGRRREFKFEILVDYVFNVLKCEVAVAYLKYVFAHW